MTAPVQTIDQRMDALHNANRIRLYRAGLKRDLRAGDRDLPLLLLNPPADLLNMKAYDLLRAAKGIGPTKANRLMIAARVAHTKTVGGLSRRQRQELVHLINTRGWCSR
jgi:hypothetical protein